MFTFFLGKIRTLKSGPKKNRTSFSLYFVQFVFIFVCCVIHLFLLHFRIFSFHHTHTFTKGNSKLVVAATAVVFHFESLLIPLYLLYSCCNSVRSLVSAIVGCIGFGKHRSKASPHMKCTFFVQSNIRNQTVRIIYNPYIVYCVLFDIDFDQTLFINFFYQKILIFCASLIFMEKLIFRASWEKSARFLLIYLIRQAQSASQPARRRKKNYKFSEFQVLILIINCVVYRLEFFI